MRRRQFIGALGGAAVWPLAARAQQPTMPVIGVLSTGARHETPTENVLAALRQGLAQAGYVEGQNVAIEYRFAEGRYDRLSALAVELVRHPVAVIATSGTPAAPAAKAATTTIPVVFLFAGDAVAAGLVASLNKPGGNVTGVAFTIAELGAKKLEMLHELVSKSATISILVNPENPAGKSELTAVEAAADSIGLKLLILNASNDEELRTASAMLAQQRPGALMVGSDPFFLNRREELVSLAARYRLPTLYPLREYVQIGGLASYGTSIVEAYRQGGMYVGRILKGEKPADLPVMQPTKFEFVINLRTARELGITISDKLLALADDVIE